MHRTKNDLWFEVTSLEQARPGFAWAAALSDPQTQICNFATHPSGKPWSAARGTAVRHVRRQKEGHLTALQIRKAVRGVVGIRVVERLAEVLDDVTRNQIVKESEAAAHGSESIANPSPPSLVAGAPLRAGEFC